MCKCVKVYLLFFSRLYANNRRRYKKLNFFTLYFDTIPIIHKMGIKNLNKHLRTNCESSIRRINLSEISGEKIAIDISIYLYKYDAENALLENIYNMLYIFSTYNITPIFVFDGKPPTEKKSTIVQRKKAKIIAQEKYDALTTKLETICEDDKRPIMLEIKRLKTQIVQITKDKIKKVKDLIQAHGSLFIVAPGEADELCALLVIKKKVWACLSEDMDLFVYGCSRVLRYFSIMDHTAVLYHTKGILKELNMTQTEFKDICILSGTDYNTNNNIHLNTIINYFYTYKKASQSQQVCANKIHFYEWLKQNTPYKIDIGALNMVHDMFYIGIGENKCIMDDINNINIERQPCNQEEIENIMKEEDFIFCKNPIKIENQIDAELTN